MTLNLRVVVVVGLILVSFLLISTTAFAKPKSLIRPGWGFGDLNHLHVGPPGRSVIVNQSNNANFSTVVAFSANTGGNSANGNTGASSVTVVSGAVSAILRILNNINQNILGSI